MNPYFIQSLENLQLGLSLSLHAVEVVKPDLIENGFASFYSLALYGPPSSGKSTIMNTSVRIGGKSVILKGTRLEKIREEEKPVGKGIFAIDDLPCSIEKSKNNKLIEKIDEFPRKAYAGISNGLIITVEDSVKKMIPMEQSFAQRLIFVPCKGFMLDATNRKCINYFQENTTEAKKYFEEFEKWYSETGKKEICKDRLTEYRRSMNCNEEKLLRVNDFIFLYKLVMKLLTDFISERYKESLNWNLIEKNCQAIRGERLKKAVPLVKELFIKTLDKKYLKVHQPKAFPRCHYFCSGKCVEYLDNDSLRCDGTEESVGECWENTFLTEKSFYNTVDLVLPEKINEVVLISDYKKVYPSQFGFGERVLVIRMNYLADLLNDQLKLYNRKHKTKKEEMSANQWARAIMEHNGCLYKIISKSEPSRKGAHTQCQFQYPEKVDEYKRVMFIRLTEEMYQLLDDIVEPDLTDGFFRKKEQLDVHNALCQELSFIFRDLTCTALDAWES